jgi:hypothetical protein
LNRLITTFDEVPPYLSPTIHIADDDGVTFFKTCTAEVFRPIPIDENRSFQVTEIRKDSAVHVSLSSSSLVKQPGARKPLSLFGEFRHPCFDGKRHPIGIGCSVTHQNEEHQGRESLPWPRGPMQRRAQWPGYRPAQSTLSTAIVNKSSHHAENFVARRSP